MNRKFITRAELFSLHQDMCNHARELMKKKNHDYSKGHPFENFMVCESLQLTSAENGILIRLSDKMSRLSSVLEKGTKVEESIEDTALDIINYTVLLMGLIKSQAPDPSSSFTATAYGKGLALNDPEGDPL